MKNKKFNKTAFISLTTLFLSLGVLFTGVMLLIMPDPTLAYWNKWEFLGLNNITWESFHAVISIYFTIMIIFHIIENSKTMLSYFKNRTKEKFKYKKELISSLIISIFITIGSFSNSFVSNIKEIFEPLSASWYTKKYEPPFEDAQALPLGLLVKVFDLDINKINKKFSKLKLEYSLNDSLEKIAEKSLYSPKNLYDLIK